jgi:membrane protein required for colicin V production
MNAIDYVIVIVIGVSTLSSLMRGLVAEVMSLVVWALALYLAATLSGAFAASFLSGITEPTIRTGSSYLMVFFGVLILGGLVNWMIRRVITKTGLSGTDRMLGALFGLSRGLLMIFSAVLFAGFTALPKQPIWQQSALLPTISEGALAFARYLPPSVRNYLKYPDAPPAERAPEVTVKAKAEAEAAADADSTEVKPADLD